MSSVCRAVQAGGFQLNFRKASLLIPAPSARAGQGFCLFKNVFKDVPKNSFLAGKNVNWLPIY